MSLYLPFSQVVLPQLLPLLALTKMSSFIPWPVQENGGRLEVESILPCLGVGGEAS